MQKNLQLEYALEFIERARANGGDHKNAIAMVKSWISIPPDAETDHIIEYIRAMERGTRFYDAEV